ncbi:S-layer homology domain-containing protein [Egicoccus sp. AB-alg2]|uniref:S-layer homology domain-containing protein n=1 Tax=Egicoccus sp. AB-alg2 TaxID=3242693 RepID=UPI00359E79D3
MRRTPIRQRLVIVGLMVGLLATIAGPAFATPQVRDFGPQIDAYARYEGQTRCLSTEQPGVRDFRALLQRTYGANGGGILRNCSQGGKSEHKEGRAYDWMLNANNASDRRKADEVLGWLLATDEHGNRHAMARRLGIMYIIWNRQVWNAYRPNEGWRPYTGASPHTDHIHFSFTWDGAQRKTSFWTAPDVGQARVAAAPGPFADIPSNYQFVRQISWAADVNLTKGVGNGTHFAPVRNVTRGQMATFLWRMMGEPAVSTPHGFTDIPSGAHYEPALRWAVAADVIPVSSSREFNGESAVSRRHMALWMHRLAGSPKPTQQHSFSDVPRGDAYDRAISFLSEYNITQGVTSTEYRPKSSVTRQQMTVFLYRFTGRANAWREADAVPAIKRW